MNHDEFVSLNLRKYEMTQFMMFNVHKKSFISSDFSWFLNITRFTLYLSLSILALYVSLFLSLSSSLSISIDPILTLHRFSSYL